MSSIRTQLLVDFGHWNCQLGYLDDNYHRVVTKLVNLFRETGIDPYRRYFHAEALVDYILLAGISDMSAEYMYRHYVYYLLSQHEYVNVQKEEDRYLFESFVLISHPKEKIEK